MLFHSWFVVTTLLGAKTGWSPQNRGGGGLSWGSALRSYWTSTAIGVFWGLAMFILSPGFFCWLSPVALGLALSIPLAVWTGRPGWGRLLRAAGLFACPAGSRPPREVGLLAQGLRKGPPEGLLPIPRAQGFTRAVVLPRALSAHLWASPHRRRPLPSKEARLAKASEKALSLGPDSLTPSEKRLLLSDASAMERLHKSVWRLPAEPARRWGII
jgi:membrane glycosyltransferase